MIPVAIALKGELIARGSTCLTGAKTFCMSVIVNCGKPLLNLVSFHDGADGVLAEPDLTGNQTIAQTLLSNCHDFVASRSDGRCPA
jgi:hypothetical protein